MIKIGSQEVTKVMKGTEDVSAVYRGPDEVWSAGGGGIDDEYWTNTVLLLDGDTGPNGANNNFFGDSSANNFTVTERGSVAQGSFSPYGDNWSNSFGSNNYYTAASDPSFNIGTGDFTVEAWVNPTQYTANNYICAMAANGGLTLYVTGGTLKIRRWFVADVLSSSTIPEVGEWTHVAATRSGTTLRIFVNGVQTATTTDSTNYAQGVFAVGNDTANQAPWYGNISNVRVLKGTALYTSNFTPPTSPLTNITNTSILTAQSNRFVDNSSNGHTLTITNSPKVTPFSPFKDDNASDITTDGGSGYFQNGAANALSVPADTNLDLSTGDFTVEMWVYLDSKINDSKLYIDITDSKNYWQFNYSSTYGWGLVRSASQVVNNGSAGAVKTGEWQHLALTRSGSNFTIWQNGESYATGTYSGSLGAFNNKFIGGWSGATTPIDGYISDFRLTKGAALYSSSFTPPTSPISVGAKTELFLKFQDAGIYDRTGTSNIVTVGNAQIDTAVKKYGTGSLKFDGSGSYLFIDQTPALDLGSGDFTVETWIYAESATLDGQFRRFLATEANGSSAVQLFINNSGQVVYAANDDVSSLTGTTNVLNGWHHVALVRQGSASGNIELYVDGSSEGSFTDTASKTSSNFHIGKYPGLSGHFQGYLDDLRITKGVARYTGDFVPPPMLLPNTRVMLTERYKQLMKALGTPVDETPDPKYQPRLDYLPHEPYPDGAVNGGDIDMSNDATLVGDNDATGAGQILVDDNDIAAEGVKNDG